MELRLWGKLFFQFIITMTLEDQVVTVCYEDLCSGRADLSDRILDAFGPDGFGVIAVRGVPDWEKLVSEALPLSYQLASLPEGSLKALEHPESLFNSGWSFGKEKLGDVPDTKKASFYFNPLADNPRPETRDQFPWALPANRWPSKELPDFETKCKALGKRMHEVVVALGKCVDALGLGAPISDELEHSFKAKGRMLYYYPLSGSELVEAASKPDGWIGWHNDSGFLTGLTPDVFFNHATGEVVPNPEPDTAGLWIADRKAVLRRVVIPKDCMAIQCGECLQVISGGKLVATPHCVRPPLKTPGVGRSSMPVFVDSSPEFKLCSPNGAEAVLSKSVKQWVPPLADRWTEGQTFADFLGSTFHAYYSWAPRE